MQYPVLTRFRDLPTGRIFDVGQHYRTEYEDRASLLIERGFIANPDDEEDGPLKHLGAGYYELPNGDKVRGKENAIKALEALEKNGADSDVTPE